MLYLLEEAEQLMIKTKVFYNQFEKTRGDIQAYVHKSQLIRSRGNLLECLNEMELSPYITW